MTRLRLLILMLLIPAVARMAADDSIPSHVSSTLWIKQLIKNGFQINNPDVQYPRFPRFLRNVYNWGDRTFNSYDSTYVVGTGKNWKLQAKSYNWMQYSTMIFANNSNLTMHSDVYADAGAYISFMAVSVGYMLNINEIAGHPTSRHTFNVDFTCSRFSGSLMAQSSNGGMTITRFGKFNDGHGIHYRFHDVSVDEMAGELFYFFNHRHYSRAAAYCYSKYQMRSAGTWILGALFTKQSMTMDFSSLPSEMLEYLPLETPRYSFRYNDYAAIGGYGYNLVLRPRKWLMNFTGLVSMGYKHSYENATDGRRDLLANNAELATALVYNHRAVFASVNARFHLYFYYNSSFIYVNSLSQLTATVGIRF